MIRSAPFLWTGRVGSGPVEGKGSLSPLVNGEIEAECGAIMGLVQSLMPDAQNCDFKPMRICFNADRSDIRIDIDHLIEDVTGK